MIIDYIRSFIGPPPSSFEYLEYTVAAVFFMLLFKFLTNFIGGLGKFMGRR